MEHEVKEHLTVDSVMTADGEVVPLGPVDKDGCRVPLDTEVLYDDDGCVIKVESYRFSTWSKRWTADVYIADRGMEVYVDSYHLHRPDSWGKLLEDLNEGANHSEYSPCFYFRKDMCDCSSCEADRYSNCDQPAFKDIASRIRKLRDEVREDA